MTAYAGLLPQGLLDRQLAGVPKRAASLPEAIASGGRAYFVAALGRTVVGFAVCGPSRNAGFPDDGELEALYVLAAFQGQGVGRALFGRCADELRAMGHAHIIVNCLRGSPALAFYRSMGGAVVGGRTDSAGGTAIVEDVLRFAL